MYTGLDKVFCTADNFLHMRCRIAPFNRFTIDQEISTLKIIRGLNFRVKNILSLGGSAT